MWLAVIVAGSLIFIDTPGLGWQVKLAAWLLVVVLVGWRWRRDRGVKSIDETQPA